MAIEFTKAHRQASPLLMALASVSGGGKTYSALIIAAGIAGPNGKVALIDTENGRGTMYADSPGIMKALPNGYLYARFDPPYSPERYVEFIKAAEDAAVTVAIIDSGSHEWEGIGGCCEIAEKNKLGKRDNWAKAKMSHKRLVNHILSSPMHLIFCLRAREKVKMIKAGEPIRTSFANVDPDVPLAQKDEVVSIGMQPICEKGFAFELTVSLQLDERTHHVVPIKVPEPLIGLFPPGKLLTVADGSAIARWCASGKTVDDLEQLTKRATTAAHDGVESYKSFFGALSAEQRKLLKPQHEALKGIAIAADVEALDAIEEVDKLPDAVELSVGTRVKCAGKLHEVWDDGEMFRWREVAA